MAVTHAQPFFRDYPGEPVPKRKLILDFHGAREDNKGRHLDHPAEHHSIRTNQLPTSVIPPIFTSDALPLAMVPHYPGFGQAPNMLACIPSGVVLNGCKRYRT